MVAAIAMLFTVASNHVGSSRGFADPATPPAPPGYIPTPIGQPPGPPTPSPTATVETTPTVAATGTATQSVATATPSPTSKPLTGVVFSVDAVRVSKVNNPGNLRGLASVRRGSSVWLMVYFTVAHLPGKVTRVATYSLGTRGQTVYKAVYNDKETKSEVGRFSRYITYKVPSTLPYGKYTLHIVVKIKGITHSRSWHFAIGAHERLAAAKASH